MTDDKPEYIKDWETYFSKSSNELSYNTFVNYLEVHYYTIWRDLQYLMQQHIFDNKQDHNNARFYDLVYHRNWSNYRIEAKIYLATKEILWNVYLKTKDSDNDENKYLAGIASYYLKNLKIPEIELHEKPAEA